jgi:hypothetical protein
VGWWRGRDVRIEPSHLRVTEMRTPGELRLKPDVACLGDGYRSSDAPARPSPIVHTSQRLPLAGADALILLVFQGS